MTLSRNVSACMAVAALVVAALAVLSPPARAASAYTDHAPILIEGNAGFTAAHGVVGGNGTPAAPYRIQGWSINAGSADGIVLRNTTAPFLIYDVIVYSGGYTYNGIVLDNVTHGTVQNATLTHDATGLVLRGATNVSLLANAALLNAWDGFDLADCQGVFLTGNSATYNRDGFSLRQSDSVRAIGNSVWLNSQDGLYLYSVTNASVVGNVVASNAWSGIDLQGGANVTVSANQVSLNDRQGVVVGSVAGLRVTSNSVFSNPGGSIQLVGVSNVTIDSNTASPAGASGIIVEDAEHVSVTRNSVSQANYSGILLGGVDWVNLSLNTLINNDVGLGGVNVSDVVLTSNLFATSFEQGISLVGSRRVTMERNNVSRNGAGVVIDATTGALMRANVLWENSYGMQVLRSTGLLVYNNSFLDNTPQAFDDGSGSNAWDDGYPVGGNYWSDYYGVDLCSGPNQSVCINPDGIGDTPYAVGVRVDRYPLMRIPGTSPKVPIASFVVAPAQGNTTTVFTFDATSSYDIEDPTGTLLVRWDFDGDGVWDTPWTTNRTVTHRFDAPGTYNVHLEVLDLSGLMSTRVQLLHVNSAPPSAEDVFLNLLPGLILLGVAVAIAASVVYRRVQTRRARVGSPAWRLPPGPPR